MWRKAALNFLRFPSVFAAVAAAVFVLALATVSAPLFLASAGNAALADEVAFFDAEALGFTVSVFGELDPDSYASADRLLREAAAPPEIFGEPTVTMHRGGLNLSAAPGATGPPVQLLARTGAIEHLPGIDEEDRDREGFWVAASVADELGLGPGDRAVLQLGAMSTPVPIAGVYRDLADVLAMSYWFAPDPVPSDSRLARYWEPLNSLVVRLGPMGAEVQPTFLVGSSEAVAALAATDFRVQASIDWAFPYDPQNARLEEAEFAVARYRSLERRISDPSSDVGAALQNIEVPFQGGLTTSNLLEGVVQRVQATVVALTASIQPLARAGQLMGLVVVGAAGLFAAHRRRLEMRLLTTQGTSMAALGVRAVVEALVPAALGGAAGWAVAIVLVRGIGPSDQLGAGIQTATLWGMLPVLAMAVVLFGAVTAAAVRRDAATSSRARALAARFPWELAVLALAAAAYYELANRGAVVVEGGQEQLAVDAFLLAFPILFIAGFAGLAARVFGRLLPALRIAGRRAPVALYLAARRVAAVPTVVLLLVTASSLAVGILVYAGTVAGSSDRTVAAKASMLVGSDVAADLDGEAPTDDASFPATTIVRSEATALPGDQHVQILGIDPATFASAAYWDDRLSPMPLAELVGRLGGSSDERLPVVVAGGPVSGAGTDWTLSTSRYELPVRVVGRAQAFPGMAGSGPLVVVATDAFVEAVNTSGSSSIDERLLLQRQSELWFKGPAQQIVAFLEEARAAGGPAAAAATGQPFSGVGSGLGEIRTADAVRERPDLAALSWTFDYLRALGVAAGLLAVVGAVLYLQARQQSREVSYVLARRMGLRRGAHRTAITVELAGMLAAASVVGAVLALVAAKLVLARLDPLPDVPPAALFILPLPLLGALAVALVTACLGGAALVQRAAERARVAEVLRVAG